MHFLVAAIIIALCKLDDDVIVRLFGQPIATFLIEGLEQLLAPPAGVTLVALPTASATRRVAAQVSLMMKFMNNYAIIVELLMKYR